MKFMKRKSTMPSLSTKRTITSHIKPLNIKKNTISDDGRPGHYLGKAQKCDGVKPVNGNPNHGYIHVT
jgi:hypothetical protein